MRELRVVQKITNYESAALEKYFSEISRFGRITTEEEVSLAQKIHQGDQTALEKLVNANLRFVVSVAKQYQYNGVPLLDLINEGNLGLIRAAEKFDETRGFKFISFAVWHIRQAIMQALAEHARVVRLPLNKVGTVSKVHHTIALLEQRYERDPTADELEAALVDLSPEEIEFAMGNVRKHVSLHAEVNDEGDSFLVDILFDDGELPPSHKVEHIESLRIVIKEVLSMLPQRSADILRMYYGIDRDYPMTFEDIAFELKMSRERVRQLKDNAVNILRNHKVHSRLNGFLGK